MEWWYIDPLGRGALGVKSKEYLTWKWNDTLVGEGKMVLYYFMIVSLYCCCVEEPFMSVMDVATIFPFLWERTIQKMNFLVWEMSLLHFLVVIKEVAVGGATSSILYNELPKEIITTRGLYSYTPCCIHKYGCLIVHQKHQEVQRHTLPHLWRAWCCMEGDIAGGLRDLVLGECTRYCMAVGVA